MSGPLVVIGDALFDVDVAVRVDRLVPDTPAPVFDEVDRQARPGGAALAALLAATDRDDVFLVAPRCDDPPANQLAELLAGQVEWLPLSASGTTPVKTRFLAGSHVVARHDRGRGSYPSELPAAVDELLRAASGILVSDYGYGAASIPAIRERLAEEAGRIPVVWDPHPRGGPPVAGAAMVTPNRREAFALSGAEPGEDVRRAGAAGNALRLQWQAKSVVVTLGSHGALLCTSDDEYVMCPAPPTSAVDTCGAGDRFAARAAVALAERAVPSDAVAQACIAASAFVAAGAAGRDRGSRFGRDRDSKKTCEVGDSEGISSLLSHVRATGGRVVATGGCFDVLHPGHVQTLATARALGDCLIVLLNSDASVRRLKGPRRPVQNAEDRARVLGALGDVDGIVIFDEDQPTQALSSLKPDIWVKGGDYTAGDLPEAALVRSWGGEVITVGYLPGRSTSQLLEAGHR